LEEITGSAAEPVARVSLSSNDRDQLGNSRLLAAGQPIRRANLWIALTSTGPALRASARDSRGQPLLLQSLEPGNAGGLSQTQVSQEIHLLFRQNQAEGEFALPSANQSFRVVSYPSLPEKNIEGPVFLVEAYQGDDPAQIRNDLVVDQATLEVNGTTLDLRRDRYAILEAAYLPGLIPLLVGGLIVLAGVILSLRNKLRAVPLASGRSAEPVHAP
jgi:hypothetical protein